MPGPESTKPFELAQARPAPSPKTPPTVGRRAAPPQDAEPKLNEAVVRTERDGILAANQAKLDKSLEVPGFKDGKFDQATFTMDDFAAAYRATSYWNAMAKTVATGPSDTQEANEKKIAVQEKLEAATAAYNAAFRMAASKFGGREKIENEQRAVAFQKPQLDFVRQARVVQMTIDGVRAAPIDNQSVTKAKDVGQDSLEGFLKTAQGAASTLHEKLEADNRIKEQAVPQQKVAEAASGAELGTGIDKRAHEIAEAAKQEIMREGNKGKREGKALSFAARAEGLGLVITSKDTSIPTLDGQYVEEVKDRMKREKTGRSDNTEFYCQKIEESIRRGLLRNPSLVAQSDPAWIDELKKESGGSSGLSGRILRGVVDAGKEMGRDQIPRRPWNR